MKEKVYGILDKIEKFTIIARTENQSQFLCRRIKVDFFVGESRLIVPIRRWAFVCLTVATMGKDSFCSLQLHTHIFSSPND